MSSTSKLISPSQRSQHGESRGRSGVDHWQSYLMGEEISVTDILAVCKLEQPDMEGFRVRESRSVIAEYMDRVRRDLVSLTFTFL